MSAGQTPPPAGDGRDGGIPRSPGGGGQEAPTDYSSLLTELRIHQVELQQQNEELRDSWNKLARSQEKYLDFYNHAPVGFATLDESGTILSANLPLARLVGSGVGRLEGRHLSTLVAPDDADPLYLHLRAVVNSPGTHQVRIRLRGAAGPVVVELHSLRAPRDEGGFVVRVSVVDVNARAQLEKDLQDALEAAKSASLAKTEFLANMSHEIRTPLNGILGALQLLKTTQMDGEQAEYIEMAIKSSRRMTNLLTDILDLSRIEAGRLQVREEEFSLASQKTAVLDVFGLTAREKELYLEFRIDERLPPVLVGDPGRLQQILLNLTGNAIKFTERGRVEVSVEPCPIEGGEAENVLFIVRDTGIGIPENMREAVFEPFRQGEQTYTKNFQGAGLGLAIVRRLVSMLNGRILLEDTPGGGATFKVLLPFLKPRPGSPRQENEAVDESQDQSRLRILLVEDDEVSLQSCMRLLQKAGHRVDVAMNGKEALDAWGRTPFDLVIMDIQMPVMDGMAATRHIRNCPDAPDKSRIPIIAMTAYAMVGDKEKFLAAGINGYISKPVQIDELEKLIGRVMDKRG